MQSILSGLGRGGRNRTEDNDTLAGVRTFPYQWRVLGFWIARAGTLVVPVDPHVIDIAVKTVSLAASAALL